MLTFMVVFPESPQSDKYENDEEEERPRDLEDQTKLKYRKNAHISLREITIDIANWSLHRTTRIWHVLIICAASAIIKTFKSCQPANISN